MDARGLSDIICYLNMEKDARKLILRDKLASAEDIATMTDLEVYEVLLQRYEVVMYKSDRILLVKKEDIDKFRDVAVYLSR